MCSCFLLCFKNIRKMEGEYTMINVNEILHRIIAEFQSIEQVTAIAIAGSKFSNYQDDLSDININVYYISSISEETRSQILTNFSSDIELDCVGLVQTDHFRLRDFLIEIDVCYLSFEEIETKLINLMKYAKVNRNESTKVAYCVHYSNIVFDRHGKLNQLKQDYTLSYPDELRRNIIQLNYPMLKAQSKSYYNQFERALNRRDQIHIISLLNDYLKSYLEIISAMNKQFDPIEKRVLQIVDETCSILPKMLKENIELLFVYASRCDKQLLQVVTIMINQLTDLMNEQGLL